MRQDFQKELTPGAEPIRTAFLRANGGADEDFKCQPLRDRCLRIGCIARCLQRRAAIDERSGRAATQPCEPDRSGMASAASGACHLPAGRRHTDVLSATGPQARCHAALLAIVGLRLDAGSTRSRVPSQQCVRKRIGDEDRPDRGGRSRRCVDRLLDVPHTIRTRRRHAH